MLELVSILGGVVARLCTWGTDYFTKKQENGHELELLDKQITLATVQSQQKQAEIQLQNEADVDKEWSQALNVALTSTNTATGNSFIDCLNALVRPTLTFWWCLVLYTISKGFLIYAAYQEHLAAKDMAGVVTNDFDRAVIGSIFGFWFCDRAIRKYSGK